ncbi:MAG: threonine ammonia-lyase [Firmicutes bacterium HGW-Firmicutes-1]|jgi:threonine dehydratase|nr:MAG: threonine ammonia-lyase [Firmicutes bacterium HGW-Firmicutes-1]
MEFDKVKEALINLKGIIKETKLIHSKVFSKESGNEIYIKPENLQITGSFKIRGAYNMIHNLSDESKKKGLVAASAGNHAQGVAFSARELNVPACIVMPKTTPLIKVEATRAYGAEVILYGDCYDEAHHRAMALQDEKGYTFVHPFDDEEVIAGQGTIGVEIVEELSKVDYIIVPIGGGGLISGVALAAKSINPNVKIIGVEPEGAMAMSLSIHENRLIELAKVDTIAEGVAVKKPGINTFEIVKQYVDEIVTVSDVDIMDAFLLLLEKEKLIAENAGVLSLAALKKLNIKDKNIVCIVSGGNIDVVTISELINRGLVIRGRVFCFSVELTDRPGELLKISTLLANLNANIIKLDHNQFKTIDRFKQVFLEVSLETNGHKHIQEIKDSLKENGYELQVVY